MGGRVRKERARGDREGGREGGREEEWMKGGREIVGDIVLLNRSATAPTMFC